MTCVILDPINTAEMGVSSFVVCIPVASNSTHKFYCCFDWTHHGNKHEDQMKSLGLYGGKERLSSIAFNTKEGLQVPFPEELAINKANFISGKLKSIQDTKEIAKKALNQLYLYQQKIKLNVKRRNLHLNQFNESQNNLNLVIEYWYW